MITQANPANPPVPIRWAQLQPSKLNPRKHFDDQAIGELAESIRVNGVLQNLVARPAAQLEIFEIVAGERRWRAIGRLIEAGLASPDYELYVVIRDCADDELVIAAMSENRDREPLTALEEADGCAYLEAEKKGRSLEELALLAGLTPRKFRLRLALHHQLAGAVRRAREEGRIDDRQMQAFTVGDKSRQEDLLAAVLASPVRYDHVEIRRVLAEALIPMARAEFDRSRYPDQKIRGDFWEELGFAADRELFRTLQLEAANEQRAILEKTWAWAELQDGGPFPYWDYDRGVMTPADAGAIVHLCDDLRVETHVGLVRKTPAVRSDERPAPVSAVSPPVESAPEPHQASKRDPAKSATRETQSAAVLVPLAITIESHRSKTCRMQEELLFHPAAAIAIAIVGLLGSQEVRVRSGPPWGFPSYDLVEAAPVAAERDKSLARLRGDRVIGEAETFRRLLGWSEADRFRLLVVLLALQVGTWAGTEPQLGDTPLAVAIAKAIGVADPAGPVTTEYLEQWPKEHLLRIGAAMGIALNASMTRSALIDEIALSDQFDPTWIPPELRFASRHEIEAELTAKVSR